MSWSTPDIARMLAQKTEATMSGNAGAFERPLGPIQSRFPSPPATQVEPTPGAAYQSYDDWMLTSRG